MADSGRVKWEAPLMRDKRLNINETSGIEGELEKQWDNMEI